MSEGWETLDGGAQSATQMQGDVVPRPSGLREAREATGLHIAALAAALKVPVKKLEALEAGRYDELPDLTFARALASSACRHLKIDPAPILNAFPQAHMPMLGSTSERANEPFKGDAGASTAPVGGGFKSPAIWITAVVLLAAVLVAFVPDWSEWPGKAWLEQGSGLVEKLTEPDNKSGGSLTTETVTVIPPTVAETQTPPDAPPPEPETSDAKPADLKTAPALSEGVASQVPAAGSVLHLEASDDSWVEVIDGMGKLQVQRVLRKGDSLDFSSTPPYSVVLGRADAVNVQVRGQAFDVAPFARNSVARFQVK